MPDDPIQASLHGAMNALGEIVDLAVAPNGWAVLVFDRDTGRANYISNCNREEMIAAMKDFIARNEPKVN